MAGGSVNNPETSRYHLEIYSVYEDHNQMIADMINHYDLNARRRLGVAASLPTLKRASGSLIFSLIGASSAMLKFEDVRIMRDMRNSVNRLVNCEKCQHG